MPQTQLGYLSTKPIQDLRAYARETEGLTAAQCARAWLTDQRLFCLLFAVSRTRCGPGPLELG
jgi:hypothetical protein